MTEVSNEAVVVTEGRRVADLAALKPGDVIRIEPANGQIQRIVVLRPAWREMTSPGQ
jgi:flagellar motor switch protein FliM